MPAKGGPIKITVSSWTIIKALLLIAAGALLFFLRDIVFLLIVAMLLAALIDPFADWMRKRRLPRGLAVLVVYIIAGAVISGALLLVVPTMVQESTALLTKYAPYIEQASGVVDLADYLEHGVFDKDFAQIIETARQSGLADAWSQITSFVFSAFGGLITAILILILAFYFVVEEEAVKNALTSFTPKKYRLRTARMLSTARTRIGYWLRGQLLLMIIIFLITYTVLTLLGVPYALVLALIAGLLEILPFIGPTLAAIPAIIIAFSLSPLQAVFVGISYFLIQQLEGDYLTPKIMQKVAGLNPITSIVAIIVGFKVAGVIGALLAIPVAMVLGVIWSEWMSDESD